MAAFIVSDHEATSGRIRDVLTFHGTECPSSHVLPSQDAAARLAREPHVELIVLNLPTDRERGLLMLPGMVRIAAGRVLVVGPTSDARLVLRALRAGATDYVDSGDLETELESSLERMAEAASGPAEPGQLIAVLAPNGGAGSSTVAVNLAAALAKVKSNRNVGLLDLKLEAGDLAAMLDLKPAFNLADLCQNASRLDRVMFERSLVKHESGVHLLAPPQTLADVAHVSEAGVGLAVTLARASFPFVVADLDHSFREEQMVVLRQADRVLMVLRLDFVSLRNVRRALEYLEAAGIDRDRIRLVANRVGRPHEVAAAKVEEVLGMKIAHSIIEDAKEFNKAINHGIPAVIASPSAKVSRTLNQIAAALEMQPQAVA